jgi:hypothetical protein
MRRINDARIQEFSFLVRFSGVFAGECFSELNKLRAAACDRCGGFAGGHGD